jgi:hypothetical protein
MIFRKLALPLILLLSCLSTSSFAAEIHSIKNLSHETQPNTPKQGEAVDSLDLDFELVSSDGIDESRFRLLINELE